MLIFLATVHTAAAPSEIVDDEDMPAETQPPATAAPPPEDVWSDADDGATRILRPSRTFDLFAQSSLVPENLLMVKRNVSKLFVIPAFPLAASGGTNRNRARTALNFAAWLLSHAAPDGAVVFAAHHEVGYDALIQAMKEQEQTNVSSSITGNIMISPVTFAASRFSYVPEEQHPALWSYLAAIDASEERYNPAQIVLFETTTFEELLQFPKLDAFECVPQSSTFKAPKATIVNGRAFLADYGRADWRHWFVTDGTGTEPLPGVHSVARNWSFKRLFKRLLKKKPRSAFASWSVPKARTVCQTRSYPVVFVMLAGHVDFVAVDQVLTALVFNPNAFVVVLTATRLRDTTAWIEAWVPIFYRANVLIKATPAVQPPVAPLGGLEKKVRPPYACADLEELNPSSVDMYDEESCVGAMIHSVFREHEGRIVPRLSTTTIVLLPLRSAIAPHANALDLLGGFSAWQPAVAVPNVRHLVFCVIGVDTALDLVSQGAIGADAADVHGLRTIGHEALVLSSRDTTKQNETMAKWIFDLRDHSSAYDAKYPQWRGHFWPPQDMRATLNQARAEGALLVLPIETIRSIGLSPWRYQIRRRRVDPIAVRAMRPDFKASLWCDVNTLEGCAMGLSNDVRWHHVCERRDEECPIRAPIKCYNVSADKRVRPQDIRPLRLRGVMPTKVAAFDTTTELERDGPTAGRLPVDVLYSVIAKGDEDFVEMAEAWLEYCLVCVLAIEVGPKGNPGAVYDTLSEGLDPTIFDRVIVNPKRGMTDPLNAPLLFRHVQNMEYARCFVAPLRVLMVAATEAPMKPGLEDYMLAHSTSSFLDSTSLIHETKRDGHHWMESYLLGPVPRVTQAAQNFIYGDRVAVVNGFAHGHFFCSGNAFYAQTKTVLTGLLGFEGSWFTGAQWRKHTTTFKLGFWVHGESLIEHMFLQPTVVEDELRREYWPESSFNITNMAKPAGRNTCLLARMIPGPLSPEEIRTAMGRAMPLQFTIKRVGTTLNDPGRAFLAEKRKADVAKKVLGKLHDPAAAAP